MTRESPSPSPSLPERTPRAPQCCSSPQRQPSIRQARRKSPRSARCSLPAPAGALATQGRWMTTAQARLAPCPRCGRRKRARCSGSPVRTGGVSRKEPRRHCPWCHRGAEEVKVESTLPRRLTGQPPPVSPAPPPRTLSSTAVTPRTAVVVPTRPSTPMLTGAVAPRSAASGMERMTPSAKSAK